MTNSITNAKAVGRLQEVIHAIYEPLSIYLLDVIAKSRLPTYRKHDLQNDVQHADFSSLLSFVERSHWHDLLVPYGCPTELRGLARKARSIRNAFSHQKYNAANYEHDLENLAKLATAIGKSDLAQFIRNKTSVQPILEDWKNLKNEGNAFFKQEQWTEAMNMYTQALKLDHQQAVLYANRALCEINLKKYQLAREDAEHAIEFNDKNVKYFRILSEALMRLELSTETKAACAAGLKLDPRDAILLVRQRDSSALEASQNYNKCNPRSLQPEPQSLDDIIAQINQFRVTSTPPDDEIEDFTDTAKCMQANALQIDMRRLYRALMETPNVHILANEKRIVELCLQAARLGNAEAQNNLGVIYGMGNFGGILRDFVRQKEYYEKAAIQRPYCRLGGVVFQNQGVAQAENGLGILYRDGAGVDVDLKKAAQYFRRSAEHGCPEGQNNFGLALLYGSGIKENQTLARAWYLKAANQGIAEAQLNYADLLANGIGGPTDISQACDYYHRAGEQGHFLASIRLQEIQTKMQKPVHKISQSNNAHFLYLQGCNYERGEGGLEKNLNLAEEYYRRAADTGLLDAEVALAELLLDHFKQNKDAFPYLKRAAEKGHPLAQYRLGKLYAFGHGCEQNSDEAHRWLRRAKMQGVKKKLVFDTDNTHVIDIESADEFNKLGAELCEFERTQRFSIYDMTIEERIRRYFNTIRPTNAPELPLMERKSSNISDKNTDCNLWFLKPENRQELKKRAYAGSVTTQRIIDGFNLLFKGLEKIETSPIQALADFRSAYRLHDPLFILPQFHKIAQARLVIDPKDGDALFVLGRTIHRSDEERVQYLEHCVELHPLAGDFHHLLACSYMFTEKYEKALKECTRALELEFNPDWLYTEAGAIRFVNDYQKLESLFSGVFQSGKNSSPILAQLKTSIALNTDESIKKYERFLELNPKDHRKVPIAYYTLGLLHMWRGEQRTARNYWHKARAADSHKVRLPCYEAVDNGYDAKLVLDAWMKKENSMWSFFIDTLGLTKQLACDFCDKANPSKRCPCGEVIYCNTECQRAHWSLHKLGVNHNKNEVSLTHVS